MAGMTPRRPTTLLLACAVSSLVFSPLACGGGDEEAAWNSPKNDASAGAAGSASDASPDAPKSDATAGSAGSAAAAGSAGEAGNAGAAGEGGSIVVPEAGPDAELDVSFAYDAPEFDSTLNQDSACAATTAEAKPVPLDIYLILDATGSMGSDCNVGSGTASKWCRSVNSIAGFVQDPSAVGNRMALQFFSSSINATCSGTYYANPKVALGELPANVQPIINALNAQAPSGLTPTEAALRGIASFTKAKQTPGRVMIGILVTDGDPTDCNESDATLANIVGNHLATNGIKTFMIGMTGATFSSLETIAVKGGAPAHANYCAAGVNSCHYYSVGDGDPQAFVAALKQIQQSAIGCTYQMPTTDAGLINPDKVTVQYTPGGGAAQELQKVDSEAQCVAGAWYYDNNANPTLISLCKQTCDTVQADSNAKVDILLGCLGS